MHPSEESLPSVVVLIVTFSTSFSTSLRKGLFVVVSALVTQLSNAHTQETVKNCPKRAGTLIESLTKLNGIRFRLISFNFVWGFN